MRDLTGSRAGRFACALLGLAALATAVGVVVLWPNGSSKARLAPAFQQSSERGEVVSVAQTPCKNPDATDCRKVGVRLSSGPDDGRKAALTTGETESDPMLDVGDDIRLSRNATPQGAGGIVPPYTFIDFERRQPIILLVLIFAALVLIFGRLRGLLSLAGLAASLLIIVAFVVPSILDGRPPLAVALVGSFAVMLLTIPLAHGIGPKSAAAALGTGASLLLTAVLALVFTHLAHLTGFSSDEATLLRASGVDISLQGLLLAGMVIGALGVLDDATISQASTVMALKRTDPAQSVRALRRRALSVGQDHVTATVNTLVLAYAGASLPVLLLFTVGDAPFWEVVGGEAVAGEVVATLVGSIGLIAAVPLTTLIAALLAQGAPEPT